MKKTLLTTSIALSLGIVTPTTHAAFTSLTAGDYTMSITSGCYSAGDNCQSSGFGTYIDNTTLSEATYTSDAFTATTRPVGSTIGSGIVGDGLMGVINFSIDGSGNLSISSFNQDSSLATTGGTFYFDALGTNGTNAMTGNIGATGDMSFTPTGREAMFSAYITNMGVQEWNRDNISGLYDTFTTGTSTNRIQGTAPAFSVTGSVLQDDGFGGWNGTLVSAGNFNGSNWIVYNETQYSEVWDINITSVSAVPVPAAAWLFGSGLLGLIGVARRNHKHS